MSANDDLLGAGTALAGALAPNITRTATLTYVVQAGDPLGALVNTVVVTGTDGVANYVVSDSASVNIVEEVIGIPGLEVDKRANVTQATVGDTITYTYRITNTGNVTFTAITADDDPLGTVAGLAGELVPNGTRTATRTYVVQESDLPGPLVNTVLVTGTVSANAIFIASDSVSITLSGPTNLPEGEQPQQRQMEIYLPRVETGKE
jgi:uncharacterized repeat protein (TIGR01451 family)